ncbi:Uncharacterized protein Fot_04374 [Forsythia ovata]|uniref:Uncharacterized protein n=1 Tax=Forsythia ovata TaxID=205694 RepID=A0ABD1XCC9_9LAMI
MAYVFDTEDFMFRKRRKKKPLYQNGSCNGASNGSSSRVKRIPEVYSHLMCRCRKLVIEAITGWTFLSKLKPEGTERTCEHVAANSLFQPGRLQPSTSITTAEYYDPVATSLYLQLALH